MRARRLQGARLLPGPPAVGQGEVLDHDQHMAALQRLARDDRGFRLPPWSPSTRRCAAALNRHCRGSGRRNCRAFAQIVGLELEGEADQQHLRARLDGGRGGQELVVLVRFARADLAHTPDLVGEGDLDRVSRIVDELGDLRLAQAHFEDRRFNALVELRHIGRRLPAKRADHDLGGGGRSHRSRWLRAGIRGCRPAPLRLR